MILICGQLVLYNANLEMYALGSKPMQLLIFMTVIIKMPQIISILLQTMIQLHKFIWEILVYLTLEIMMV